MGLLRPGEYADSTELIALVRDTKGPVDFVAALPLIGPGKPNQKALRAAYWGGAARGVA